MRLRARLRLNSRRPACPQPRAHHQPIRRARELPGGQAQRVATARMRRGKLIAASTTEAVMRAPEDACTRAFMGFGLR